MGDIPAQELENRQKKQGKENLSKVHIFKKLELNKDDGKDASKNEMMEKQEELDDTFEMKSEKSQQFESKINSFNSYAQSNQLAG